MSHPHDPGSGARDQESLYVIALQPPVSGGERKTLDARLGDEHPVERVAIDMRQLAGSSRVGLA